MIDKHPGFTSARPCGAVQRLERRCRVELLCPVEGVRVELLCPVGPSEPKPLFQGPLVAYVARSRNRRVVHPNGDVAANVTLASGAVGVREEIPMFAFQWQYIFDRVSYEPGGVAQFNVDVSNSGAVPVLIESISLLLPWGPYSLEVTRQVVDVGRRAQAGAVKAQLPTDQLGTFRWSIVMSVRYRSEGEWSAPTQVSLSEVDVLKMRPNEVLPVFVSRGVRPEDRCISDPLVAILQEWSMETRTVGVEILVPDDQVPARVRQEVLEAPGLVLVATPRSLDAISNAWKTFEWGHAELGMAYAQARPILVLCADGVEPAGLPSYLDRLGQVKWIQFDGGNPEGARGALNAYMFWYRDQVRQCLKKMKSDRFWGGVKGVLAVVGGVASAAAVINAFDSSGDDEE